MRKLAPNNGAAVSSLVETRDPSYLDEMSRWIVHDLFSKIPECHGYVALSVAFAQFVAVKCDVDPFDQKALEPLLRETSCAQEVLRWFLRLLQSGKLKSASRPIGGGALVKMTGSHWQVDDGVERFLTSQYSRADPFDPAISPDSWIFIDESDVARLWDEHVKQTLHGSLPKCPKVAAQQLARSSAKPIEQATTENLLLGLAAVEDAVGLGRSSIYKLIESGGFPSQIKVGNRSLWRRADIANWIEQLKS